MVHRLSSTILLSAASALLLLMLLTGGLLLRPSPAQAQNVMAVPACQCSAPTSVLGSGGSRLVHCVCGALSCVIVVPVGTNQDAQQLQCRK